VRDHRVRHGPAERVAGVISNPHPTGSEARRRGAPRSKSPHGRPYGVPHEGHLTNGRPPRGRSNAEVRERCQTRSNRAHAYDGNGRPRMRTLSGDGRPFGAQASTAHGDVGRRLGRRGCLHGECAVTRLTRRIRCLGGASLRRRQRRSGASSPARATRTARQPTTSSTCIPSRSIGRHHRAAEGGLDLEISQNHGLLCIALTAASIDNWTENTLRGGRPTNGFRHVGAHDHHFPSLVQRDVALPHRRDHPIGPRNDKVPTVGFEMHLVPTIRQPC